jgi:histidine triad (HIT) family protein
MASIFSKIAAGEIASHKIAEDDRFFAFLDINPLAKGHTLVIPKKEVDNIFDLSDNDYQGLFLFAKKIAKSIEKCIKCEKVGIAVVGLEVPHAHIHLVPINAILDIDFSKPRLKIGEDEYRMIAQRISANIE